jgi:hypothetical protein
VVDLSLPNTVDVTAVAVAEIADICTTDCLKPWAIPDRWDDLNDNGVYDPGEPYDPILTGYVPPGDVGTPIVLKIGNPHASIAPGQFFPVDFPPLGYGENPHTGGDYYREWIATCSPYPIAVGDSLQLEPGNMVGPTDQGVDELIALDPTAYWDEERRTIGGSAFGLSPRAIKVPFFDPTRPPDSGRNWVYVTKIAAFFLESRGPGSRVNARFMELASPGTPCPEGAPPSFIHGLTLVQ